MATVLYVALAGRAPWDDPSAVERWELGQGDEPPWLQELAPWVDGAVARVVHGAMLRDAEQRCPSAYSLLGALVACLRGEDTLRWDMLEASREELRAPVASRAEPPASWQELAEGPSVGDLTDSLLGVTLDGRFELVRRVGAGGMGAVYEARDPDGNTRAIKVIKLELLAQGGDTLRRFVREARAAQAIDSDHVVRVIEAGSDLTRGLPFIVMEMLRGGDLASFVQANGPMDPTAAAWVFWRACQGLGRAHALGMVHRDVKPANIFLHESDNGTIIPKLCDFGVAKVDASLREHSATALTQTGGILGSPLYMAPEHAENAKHADARSDVWSLGISLYETLTGARPWADCSTIGELLLALYTKEVTPLQDRAPWVSPGLTALVHRALQREPTRRFADANEMALALAPFAKPFAAAGPTALQCVSPELRSRPAPRLDVAAVSGAAPVTTAPGRQSGRPLSTGLWAMGATVLLAAAGLAFYATRAVAPPAPDSAALPPPAVPSASRAAASVRIVPESASVSVDGMPAAVNAGTLTLVRGPGETAVVVVESAGVRQAASVVITADGRAVPDTIEVAPPTTSASASASPTVAVAGIAPPSTRTVPTKGAEATTQTAAPPPAASPTVPKFNKSW